MANNAQLFALRHRLRALVRSQAQNDDDKAVFDALSHNDVQHVCQAIRETRSGEVVFQHVTLRLGQRHEQSVHQLPLSVEMKYALDLFSLYLALRYCRFQLDTFHPELRNPVVVPIDLRALCWSKGYRLLQQMIRSDKEAFQYLIPSLMLNATSEEQGHPVPAVLATLRAHVCQLCYDVHVPFAQLNFAEEHQPDLLKISLSLSDSAERAELLPLIRYLRRHKLPWIAGRVTCQNELNQYKALGASHYFGYFSDLPSSISFRSFETYSEAPSNTATSGSKITN